ncbi:MAG: hypothetical protein GX448_18175 [Planctomycetes bacterium]|nr:hypothetical protein [Planctomycetota bacterium]
MDDLKRATTAVVATSMGVVGSLILLVMSVTPSWKISLEFFLCLALVLAAALSAILQGMRWVRTYVDSAIERKFGKGE